MTRSSSEAIAHRYVDTLSRMLIWSAISQAFGIIGAARTLAIMSTDALGLDDIELHERCDRLSLMLGIPLELPLMKQPLGRLASYCERKLMEKEQAA